MIMKTTNIIKAFSWLLFISIFLSSCEEDGNKIYLSSPLESDFIASTDQTVLTKDIAQKIVLSFSWTKSAIFISDPDLKAPEDILLTYIQASTEEDFSSNIIESEEEELSRAYTAAELSVLAKNLGMTAEVARNIYFRLRATTGRNLEGTYSKTLTVNVTPYLIDMSIGMILDGTGAETGITLSSPDENGVYTGFIGATGWYNFYLLEGDGVLWGNPPADGNEFKLSSGKEIWNCWFPGAGGCYYTVFNTPQEAWSALYLETLEVSGDLTGSMTFDRPNTRWTYVFNAPAATTINIRLNGAGQQYNQSTGTDADAAIETPVAFVQNSEYITMGSQSETISVTIPQAGESTLIVDLSDPNGWICEVKSGADRGDEIPEYLYLAGIDDLISGSWTFDNYVTLYNEDNKAYAGIVNINSEWGYTIHTEIDNWGDKYTLDQGDEYTGTLIFTENPDEGDNIPAPPAGLYLIDISIKGLTYEVCLLKDTIYVAGLNDVWSFDTMLTTSSTPGVYSGRITIVKASAWGFAIYLFDDDWNHMFGGSGNKLYYSGSNITDDANLSPATYTMTVDLINGTYSIQQTN